MEQRMVEVAWRVDRDEVDDLDHVAVVVAVGTCVAVVVASVDTVQSCVVDVVSGCA